MFSHPPHIFTIISRSDLIALEPVFLFDLKVRVSDINGAFIRAVHDFRHVCDWEPEPFCAWNVWNNEEGKRKVLNNRKRERINNWLFTSSSLGDKIQCGYNSSVHAVALPKMPKPWCRSSAIYPNVDVAGRSDWKGNWQLDIYNCILHLQCKEQESRSAPTRPPKAAKSPADKRLPNIQTAAIRHPSLNQYVTPETRGTGSLSLRRSVVYMGWLHWPGQMRP